MPQRLKKVEGWESEKQGGLRQPLSRWKPTDRSMGKARLGPQTPGTQGSSGGSVRFLPRAGLPCGQWGAGDQMWAGRRWKIQRQRNYGLGSGCSDGLWRPGWMRKPGMR